MRVSTTQTRGAARAVARKYAANRPFRDGHHSGRSHSPAYHPHQTGCCSELIGWENSDAHEQYTSVCRYRRFACDWFRSMGGFAHQCACFPFDRTGASTVPTNDEHKGTANGGVCRLHLRVPLNGHRGVANPLMVRARRRKRRRVSSITGHSNCPRTCLLRS